MIVNHSLRLIFISNPKNGSSSIEAALSDYDDEDQLNSIAEAGLFTGRHMPAYIARYYLGEDVWNSYFKFAFVRNPWDWFVSQHFYNLQMNKINHDPLKPLTVEDIMATYEFLRIAKGHELAGSAAQFPFICDTDGNTLVDFVGRFETMNKCFQTMMALWELDVELPHINASHHENYRYYYTAETRELVGQLYRTDVSIFGYGFD